MKKVGGIALLCISLILVSVILVGFLQKKYDYPDYEMNDFSEASEEERDAIALFMPMTAVPFQKVNILISSMHI